MVRVPRVLVALVGLAGLVALVAAPARADEAPRAPQTGRAAIWHHLAATHDANRDGRIEKDEYGRKEATFERLDEDDDGVLTAADFKGPATMDRFVARAVLMRFFQADGTADDLGRRELCIAFAARDLDGNGRWSLPELRAVRAAFRGRALGAPDMPAGVLPWVHLREAIDRDASGDFTLAEIVAFFDAEDEERTGRWSPPPAPPQAAKRPDGPAAGDVAPAFDLPTPTGDSRIALESLRGKPVVLAFGSFT